MPDNKLTEPEKPHPTPRDGDNVHERPEVKPLVEKAGAERERRVPQGTMKTGGDIPGGGGTQSLELPTDPPQNAPTEEKNED